MYCKAIPLCYNKNRNKENINEIAIKDRKERGSMTLIIKIWLGLAVISVVVQSVLARKKVSHLKGLILPIMFFIFGIYAWIDLSNAYIGKIVRTAFLLPALILFGIFEIVYWKTVTEEKGIILQKIWIGWVLPIGYWMLMMPWIYRRFLSVSEIRKVPDYYSTVTFLFPGLLFLMIYYIVFYYRKQKNN